MAQSVDEVIEGLGNTGAVATALGLNPSVVSSWRKRRSIPAERWLDLARLAQERAVKGITLESLAALHTKRAPAEARP